MQTPNRKELIRVAKSLHKKNIPIIPLRGKRPITKEWEKHCHTLPTKMEMEMFESQITNSIGVPLGSCSGFIAIDIDATDEQEYKKIREILPKSPIVKKGKKGATLLFKFNGEESEKIKRGSAPLVELLSEGSQTVIPPSIHPETKKPYRYLTKYSLENFDVSKLPLLPRDAMDKLRAALDLNKEEPEGILSSGRNDKLKEMASAMLFDEEKNLDQIANELVAYDMKTHSPPLFSDKQEGMNKKNPFSNALQFVNNVLHSINGKRADTPLIPGKMSLSTSKEDEIEVLTLGEFFEPDRFPERVPVVEGLMNQQELHLFSAPAKTGKTIMQVNLALAVARGEPFLQNFKTHKGKVLIIQTEVAGINFQERLIQITQNNIKDIKDFVFISSNRVKIDTEEGRKKLERIINRCKPSLVILDPFYTLHNANEDSSSEIAPILTDLREIIIRTNTTCLLIHHQGKGVANNNQVGHKHRGSSSFADVPDGSWSLNKLNDPKMASLSFELRNHKAPNPLRLTLGDDLKWKSDGFIIEEDKTLTVDLVKEELAKIKEVTSGVLVDHLKAKFSLSKKTVQNKIKDAYKSGIIVSRQEGRNKYYSCAKKQAPRVSNSFLNQQVLCDND